MRPIFQRIFAIFLSMLLPACTSYPKATEPDSQQTPFAEVQAKKPDENLCPTIRTMAITITVSRHILGQSKDWVISETKKDYTGLDRTIESMVEEAFEGNPLNTPGEATEAGTQLGKKWGSYLEVCDETGS